MNSPASVPSGEAGIPTLPFKITRDTEYYLFARVRCPSADDDSFWVKIDDGKYASANGLGTGGWEWVKLDSVQLKPGEHKLKMTYREDGALLDKICISTYLFDPSGLEEAKVEKPTLDDSEN